MRVYVFRHFLVTLRFNFLYWQGVGINLFVCCHCHHLVLQANELVYQSADTVIIYDPDFNPHQVRFVLLPCCAIFDCSLQDLQVSR